MLNKEYKTKVIKELENISTKELINLLKEVGSTRVNDGNNVESDFKGDAGMLTKEELWEYAKKIQECCKYHLCDDPDDYGCLRCPFYIRIPGYYGCIFDKNDRKISPIKDWFV